MFKSVTVSGRTKPDVLVLGIFQPDSEGKSARQSPRLDNKTAQHDQDGALAEAIKRPECTGESGRIVEAHRPRGARGPRLFLVGLGKQADFDAGSLRNIAASVGRLLLNIRNGDLGVELTGPIEQAGVDAARAGQAFGEGMGLLGYDVDAFRKKHASSEPRIAVSLQSSDRKFQDGMKRGVGLAESANVARMLSQTPANIATTDFIASEAQKMARKVGLNCRVIKGKQLETEKLNGLINVGKASEFGPCLIRLEYKPANPKKGARPVVFVGKTMVYDSGGLSLKISGSMRGMKRDKDGGCGVFGAMHAIATVIKPKVPVVALLSVAENSVSDEAYRPDDIFTFRNGVTCEVTNTDAEGRLVMADALCWACDKEKPGCIIDMATLTGGVVVALGSTFAGMWCDDDDLRERIQAAADATGERVWRLPHDKEYMDMMKSDVADIVNSNPNRKAHPIQGAAFLKYFVKADIPWCHLDIAGVHAVESDTGPYAKGTATGFGTRLLAEFVAQM